MSLLPPPPNLILLADITLYPTEKGGRSGPLTGESFDCQVWLYEEYRECRILLEGVGISPGETRRYRVHFVTDYNLDGVRQAGRFELFENRIIGEGVIVQPQPQRDYPAFFR